MDLDALNQQIPNLANWSHADKIKLFAWHIHSSLSRDRFVAADIRQCYDTLHLERPSDVGPFLAAMEKRKPKEALRDNKGYRLEKRIRDSLDLKYGQRDVNPMPATEPVLANSVIEPTRRGYHKNIIQQANGCYERGWYDACSVMIRKFVEILVIEVYEANGREGEIKDSNGDYKTLRDLVTAILNSTNWSLGRETKKCLPEIKTLGDRAAHNRRFIATKPDVDKIIPGLRVIADELLHLAKLK